MNIFSNKIQIWEIQWQIKVWIKEVVVTFLYKIKKEHQLTNKNKNRDRDRDKIQIVRA